jgi:hypothetical protein
VLAAPADLHLPLVTLEHLQQVSQGRVNHGPMLQAASVPFGCRSVHPGQSAQAIAVSRLHMLPLKTHDLPGRHCVASTHQPHPYFWTRTFDTHVASMPLFKAGGFVPHLVLDHLPAPVRDAFCW